MSNEEFNQMKVLEEIIYNLRSKLEMLEKSNSSFSTHAKEPRLSNPEFFNGSRSETKKFLTQVNLVIRGNPSRFPSESSKIIFAVSYMRGAAFTWIQPHLDNFTAGITDSFTSFCEALFTQFGEKNEKSQAERLFYELKQNNSVSLYATEFSRLSTQLGWNEAALCAHFYRGLKPNIKDQLALIDRPTELQRLMELSIKLDNRLYERYVERKLDNVQHIKTSHAKTEYIPHQPRYDNKVTPMEIDSLSQNYVSKRDQNQDQYTILSSDEKERRRKNNLCLYCGKVNHSVNNCPILAKKNNLKEQTLRN